MNGLAYGDDYGMQEDEGYYEEGADIMMSVSEYEDLLFQHVLDKIRLARATGESDVQLSPEELELYQSRVSRSRVPAAHPQAARYRQGTGHAGAGSTVAPAASSSGNTGTSRSKKKDKRSSFFSSKSKDKKSSNRSRAASNASDMLSQPSPPPPGFMVPGPNGQPMFAPINAYQGRMTRDVPRRPSGSPRSSRSASISSEIPPVKGGHATQTRGLGLGPSLRLPQTPTRLSYTAMPGAFPGSPINYSAESPTQAARPSSSSSRHSKYDMFDRRQSAGSGHTVSSPVQQQAPKLVPFPTIEYQHHTPEPYQYQAAGQIASASSTSLASQPQYSRRVASSPTESTHMSMPRRVPVPAPAPAAPVQRAPAPVQQDVHHSTSDPVLTQRVPRVGPSDDEEEARAPKKAAAKESSSGGKRKGKSRRKN